MLNNRRLDTAFVVSTPEGVEIGSVVRGLAWAIDFAIRLLAFLAIIFVLSQLSTEFAGGLIAIIYFVLEWLYPTIFEASSGATPGKRMLKIRVVQDDGTPLTFVSSVIRNFLRAVDFLPLFYATGLIAMNNNRQFKRLGDLAAGSIVIYAPPARKKRYANDGQSLAPPSNLTIEDRLALINFVERAEGLSTDRQIELANGLSGLTGVQGEESVNTIKAWAHWILQGQSFDDNRPSAARSVG